MAKKITKRTKYHGGVFCVFSQRRMLPVAAETKTGAHALHR